jgi:phage tail sheath protein FI
MPSYVSPGVYVLEKDISNYPVSLNPSVVGIVGFAGKGPENKATLITSQEQLINTFGKPSEDLEGQGLEAALEILEATNSLYFVRAIVEGDKADASATIPFGACPAVCISSLDFGSTEPLYLRVQVTDNLGLSGFATPKVYALPAGTAPTQTEALRKVIGTGGDQSIVSIQNDGTNDFLVSRFAGVNCRLQVTCASSADFNTVGPDSVVSGALASINKTGDVNPTTASSIVVSGMTFDTTGGDSLAYLVESLYAGADYNYRLDSAGRVLGNTVEITPLGGKNVRLTINDAGAATENFVVSLVGSGTYIEDLINTGEVDTTSDFIKGNLIDNSVDFPATELADFSNKITALGINQVDAVSGTTGTVVVDATPRFVKPIQGTYNLAGGNSGGSGITDDIKAAIIGEESLHTGIYALDYDILNISLACTPDIHDENVQNALITLAEVSQNFLAVVSPPYGKDSVQEAIEWSNGLATERTSAINNSYAAIFWPWVKTYDNIEKKDKWYDPAIYGIRQMCFTDSVADAWFAPAGFRRGRLTKPTDVEVDVGQGDRDNMYSGGNAINPIVNFPQQGITIFGQRTAQRTPTALDRINVRRLMILIRKILLNSTQQFVFEPHDPATWEQVAAVVEGILADIVTRRGITEFKVICDETTNTPVRIDRSELWCKVLLKPTKAAEIIVFELNLTNQAANLG